MAAEPDMKAEGYLVTDGDRLEEFLREGLFRSFDGRTPCTGSPSGRGLWLLGPEVAAGEPPAVGAGVETSQPGKGDGGPRAWRRAQTAERAFWKSWRRNPVYQSVELGGYWQEIAGKTGGEVPPGTVLDVGCGPVSFLNFARGQAVRGVGVDPLADFYFVEGLVESRSGFRPIPMVAAPGERLPFPDSAFDGAVCFNVLDHAEQPDALLAEMERVVAPGGWVRLFVHTFSGWAKHLLFFDRPHLHHWDLKDFRAMLLRRNFRIVSERQEPKSFDIPPGLGNAIRHLPYRVASRVMFTAYYLLTNEKPS